MQAAEPLLRHPAGPMQTEDAVGGRKARCPQAPLQQPRERRGHPRGRARGRRIDLAQHRERLVGNAHRANTESPPDGGHQPADHRVQMEMFVGVAMIERQSRGAEPLELRGDLGGELTASARAERDGRSERRHVGPKAAVGTDQPRHLRCGERRAAFHQHQMQSDAKSRHEARARDGIRGRHARHHEARRREDSAAMGGLDSLVDFMRRAEVVRGHDQSFQAASLTTGSADPSRATSKLSSRH